MGCYQVLHAGYFPRGTIQHVSLISSPNCKVFDTCCSVMAHSRLNRIDWHAQRDVTDEWILALFGIDSSTVTPVVAGLSTSFPTSLSTSLSNGMSHNSNGHSNGSGSATSSPSLRPRTSAWEEKSPLLNGSSSGSPPPPLPTISSSSSSTSPTSPPSVSSPLVRPIQMPSPLHHSLTDVKLARCTQLTDDALRPLAYCHRLAHLNLSGTSTSRH
jgi:hypothetical protein